MRIIVHLSDIHFGRVDEKLIEPLISLVHDLHPHVVAISGDLTQRARTREFLHARAFLDRLPTPQIVVPGNHDIPLYNLVARFGSGLAKYRRHITSDLFPFHTDDEIAIAGLNTARALTHKGGRINRRQLAHVAARFVTLDPRLTRIVVTHHPFDVPEGHTRFDIVGRARLALETFAVSGIDLYLSGHLHVSHIAESATRYKIAGYSALLIQAGTTTSTRLRQETNALNVIHLDPPHITVECLEWCPDRQRFQLRQTSAFRRTPTGWTRPSHPSPSS
jgi:3',5'-cyclic AMP phosphodiesterase CpdA